MCVCVCVLCVTCVLCVPCVNVFIRVYLCTCLCLWLFMFVVVFKCVGDEKTWTLVITTSIMIFQPSV